MYVVIRLYGGLGNILFQLGKGIHEKSKGHLVMYDASWFVGRSKENLLCASKISGEEVFSYSKVLGLFLRLVTRGSEKRILFGRIILYNSYLQKSQNLDYLTLNYDKNVIVKNRIILHYRLGDYRTSKSHQILSPDFFISELRKFDSAECEIYLSTDEIESKEIKEILCVFPDIKVFEENVYRTWLFFRTAETFIGSNSTFSYTALVNTHTRTYYPDGFIESFL